MTEKVRLVGVFLVGALIGALWMRKHLSCKPCQDRWRALKRRIGLKMVE